MILENVPILIFTVSIFCFSNWRTGQGLVSNKGPSIEFLAEADLNKFSCLETHLSSGASL